MSNAAVIDAPAANGTELALIDLSSIAYPIFLMSAAEPDPNAASTKIVERIRSLTAQHPHAAICCDAGKSFRAEIDPTYKAQREAAPEALHHQIRLAKEQLEADGYPVWSVRGFEADDLIASATAKALAIDGASVLIISADKDMLQLVGPKVRVLRPARADSPAKIYDTGEVITKFGVRPEQMRDYLALVGDASDNIKGAHKIGPKIASRLLGEHGTLDKLLYGTVPGLTPSVQLSLSEFKERSEAVCKLITLRNDAPIPFEEIASERAPRDVAPMEDEMQTERTEIIDAAPSTTSAPIATAPVAGQPSVPNGAASGQPNIVAQSRPLIEADTLAPAPVEFERQLEPRSLPQAMQLANHMHQAHMFNGYGSGSAVLSTILAGRELGIQAVASLRAFHVVEGRHMLAADALRGLVMRSGLAKYFRCVERTDEKATFETWRKDEPEPVRLTFSIEDGRKAFGFDADMAEKARLELDAKWRRSGWGKNPADMNIARAGAKLARLVYPEVTHGLYCREEMEGAA